MALTREVKALTAILADGQNEDKTAEDIATEIILALDELRSKTHRLAVVASYAWKQGEEPSLAVLGPFSTRAPAAARGVGQGMAGTAKGGHGKWLLVPAYANVRAAWDAVQPEPGSAHERALEARLGGFYRQYPAAYTPLAGDWATCCCGVKRGSFCLVHKKRNEAA